MGVHENLSGAARAARFRAAKRAQGLRLKQMWVPDLRNPQVRAGLQADAAALAAQGQRWSAIVDDAEAMAGEVLDSLFPEQADHPKT